MSKNLGLMSILPISKILDLDLTILKVVLRLRVILEKELLSKNREFLITRLSR